FHQALTYHCKEWINHYGQHLYNKMSNKLKEIDKFDMVHIQLIDYPNLIRIQKEINGLNILFNSYDEFKRNKKLMSNILWTGLNINDLIIKRGSTTASRIRGTR
ncbi:unnamed protein product, partial [Rotaria sp. Silwood2]